MSTRFKLVIEQASAENVLPCMEDQSMEMERPLAHP